ncbi:hypothetical protein IRJ41_020261, partial [Triplophysa rosa]
AKETLLKILCGNNGAMEYERVLDLSYGLPELSDLDQVIKGDIFTVIQHSDSKEIIVKADVKLCNNSECDGAVCGDLHMCKYELMMGHCNRRVCVFGHELISKHNIRVLRDHQISALSREELCVMLLQSDSNLLPPVCVLYNRSGGPYGRCPEKEQCTRLHVCESFIRGCCDVTECGSSHDFHGPDTLRVLRRRGVSDHLMSSLPFIYRNILTLKRHRNIRPQSDLTGTKQPVRQKRRNTELEICLSFVKGFCKNRECSRIHFKMPYKWEVKVDDTWAALPNNEEIEREYCEPSNVNSSGTVPVCFEDMTLGLNEVLRLSTEPSVLFPSFIFTTTWIWYWRDQYDHWIQYASLKEMHRMCMVCSDELEKRYQESLQLQNPSDQDDVVRFRAGKHFYQLNFKDMVQRNEVSGTERPVRRRPVFVSSVDVHISRTRKNSSARPHVFKGFPGFWDQSAIPDRGFQRVRLHPSDRDYARVQDLFCQTMSSFTIRQIERVQNRKLWGIFITKKEALKKTNQERFGERLLFHDTKSSLLDVVCCQNFDIGMSDTSEYGKGIYFSKEAQSCHKNTDECGVRMMFVCRVLLGHYTRGAFHYCRPPPKNATGDHYHSCVDNLRDPSVFVLFDRSQIYPEFLITYEQNKTFEMSLMASAARVNVKNVRQTPESSDVRTNPSSGIKSSPAFASASGSEQTSGSSSSSRETHSLSALSGSTINTNLILSTRDPVSNVPKTDLNAVLMMTSDEIPLLTPLQPAVQLHAWRFSSDPDHQNISVESVNRSSSENTQKVPEIYSGSVTSSSSGTIQDVSEIRSSSGTIQDGSEIRSSSGTIQDVSEIRSSSGTIRDVSEIRSSSGTIRDVSEIRSSSGTIRDVSEIRSSSGTIRDVSEIRSSSGTIRDVSEIRSSSGTIRDVSEIRSSSGTIRDVSEIRSSSGTIRDVSEIRSSSGTIRDVSEIRSSSGTIRDVSEIRSSSGTIRDVSEIRSSSGTIRDVSEIRSSSGTIRDVSEIRSSSGTIRDVSEIRSSSGTIRDVSEIRSSSGTIRDVSEIRSSSGTIRDVSEIRSSSGTIRDVSEIRSSSGTIRDVSEIRSCSAIRSSSGTIQDVSEIHSGSEIRSSSGTIQDVSEIRSSSGTIRDVSEIRSSSGTIRDVSEIRSSSGTIRDVSEILSCSAIRSSSGTIRDVSEIHSGSEIRSSSGTIQDVSEILSCSAIRSSSGTIQDVSEILSCSEIRSSSGTIQDVSEILSCSAIRSSSGTIQDVSEILSCSAIRSSSGTIQDVSEILSCSAIRSSSGTIQDVSEILSCSAIRSSSGTIRDVSEIRSGSAIRSSSGTIRDVSEIRSGSAIGSSSGTIQDVSEIRRSFVTSSSSGTIQDVSEIHSGSAIRSSSGNIHDVSEVRSGSVSLSQLRGDSRDSLSTVVQYSNYAVKLSSPPVAVNRSSVSDGVVVSSAQSLSRSSGSVSNSLALSSRQTVCSHYGRENSSAMRRESAERSPHHTTTTITTEGKKCTVM